MSYSPIYQLTRGKTVESIHYGSIAVVDSSGRLIAGFGEPDTITFLRSSAKPFQALPFIERQGHLHFNLTDAEIAILCASHSGTDEHAQLLKEMHRKIGSSEDQLLCGVHMPIHQSTADVLRDKGEKPTPFRHNCSGKHTGMLAFVKLLDGAIKEQQYISFEHPIQKLILDTFAYMCALEPGKIELGVDGCSAPNFAVPLYNAAYAYARLVDPEGGIVMPPERLQACRTISSAMIAHPFMVAGPERFDTRLLELGAGRFVAKGGAEGYQGIGIKPGVFAPGSPGIGIAVKIADGDIRGKIVSAVAVEILRQLGVLGTGDMNGISDFGPGFDIFNWRKILVGEGSPIFNLEFVDENEENAWNHASMLN